MNCGCPCVYFWPFGFDRLEDLVLPVCCRTRLRLDGEKMLEKGRKFRILDFFFFIFLLLLLLLLLLLVGMFS